MLLTCTFADLELIALCAVGLCFAAKEMQQCHQLMLDRHLPSPSFALLKYIVSFYLFRNPIQCISRASVLLLKLKFVEPMSAVFTHPQIVIKYALQRGFTVFPLSVVATFNNTIQPQLGPIIACKMWILNINK